MWWKVSETRNIVERPIIAEGFSPYTVKEGASGLVVEINVLRLMLELSRMGVNANQCARGILQ